MESYIKLETISLKNHPEINERWVQQKCDTCNSLTNECVISITARKWIISMF